MIQRPIFLLIVLAFAAISSQAQIKKYSQTPPSFVQRQTSIAGVVYQKNAQSIVVIEATDQSGSYQGSGVAFNNGGTQKPDKTNVLSSTWIITNAHVVKNATVVNVIVDGLPSKASVKYRDSEFDIAILWAEDLVVPSVPSLGRGMTVSPGDPVYAIGAPKGLPRTITEGIVSAKRTMGAAKLIQTTAAISPGSSGGGLFDQRGNLIGITTFKVVGGESLNFALDVNQALELIEAVYTAAMLRVSVEKKDLPKFGDAFVKWIFNARGNSGERIVDEFKKAESEFFKDSDSQKFNEYLVALINRYLSTVAKNNSANSAQAGSSTDSGNPSAVIRLVCQLKGESGGQRKRTFAINFDNQTVNGFKATFTDGYLRYSSTSDKDERYDYVFDRTASTLTVSTKEFPNLQSGPCTKAESRAF